MTYEFLKPETDKETPETPQILSFKVSRKNGFLGYQASLRWTCNFDPSKIIGFKIWRAISTQVLLNKSYILTQASLERLSGIKNFYITNNNLYNKCFFSQNSKIKFFNTDSERYSKLDETENFTQLKFVQIDFIPEEKDGFYEFVDKNVKFGQTYFYAISLMTTNLFETEKSQIVKVNIEDLDSPDAPSFEVSEASTGALISISTNTKAEDVVGFSLYRRSEKENVFQKLADFLSEGDSIKFIDSNVFPATKYFYKVYSVDFFGNISNYSAAKEFVFSSTFNHKKSIPNADFSFEARDGVVYIDIVKNNEDIVGYRIERKDVWRFETNFEIKSYNNIPFPNINFFDQDGKIAFIDRGVHEGRVYAYRVSGIKKNGYLATSWITPPFKVKNGTKYESNKLIKQPNQVSLGSFSIDVLDEKQSPLYSKISWEINGEWCYLVLSIEKRTGKDNNAVGDEPSKLILIDSIHQFIYLNNLEPGNNYIINMSVHDCDGKLLLYTEEEEAIRIST